MTTIDLTERQARIDALAGVKIPCEVRHLDLVKHKDNPHTADMVSTDHHPKRCPKCGVGPAGDSTGEVPDPRFDVLRVECPGVLILGKVLHSAGVERLCPCKPNGPRTYTTLPASEAHGAVGKLANALPDRPAFFKAYGFVLAEDNPPELEDALLAALVEAQGLVI